MCTLDRAVMSRVDDNDHKQCNEIDGVAAPGYPTTESTYYRPLATNVYRTGCSNYPLTFLTRTLATRPSYLSLVTITRKLPHLPGLPRHRRG